MKQEEKKSPYSLSKLFFIILLLFFVFPLPETKAANDNFSFVILSTYEETLHIGDEFYLFAFTSTSKTPTFKSSNSTIASVNTYGLVTAKKDGTVKITAKIKNAEASCYITVQKTKIELNEKSISLECGDTVQLLTSTSNGSQVTYKSSKSSIATVNETGLITAVKPGETTIAVKADTTLLNCTVKVKTPTLKLSNTTATLYRMETLQLLCNVSSNKSPVYKSNRSSIATVDQTGKITAIKHGTAIITATVDGVSKTCIVTVKQPTITISKTEITLTEKETATITATVSSGNEPIWSSSNINIATVEHGIITAVSNGTAYIYVKEDGIKVRCKIKVIPLESNS